LVARVDVDRLQQPVADGAGGVVGLDETLVDQAIEMVDDLRFIDRPGR
jgi:hypothetical protein